MKTLPTVARLHELLDYDPVTGIMIWKVRTSNRISVGDQAGCVDKRNGKWSISIDGSEFMLHRVAWKWFYGEEPPELIDHRDNNPSHNWVLNLREATKHQNAGNSRCHADSLSGIKGVTKKRNKWSSKICVNGSIKNLGTFNTPEEAAEAYAKAAECYFGEFARLS